MEISPTPSPLHTHKNLPNMAKIFLYMLRKAISKTKLLFDLHVITILKQTKLAMLHHHHHLHRYAAALTCRSTDLSFITPGDYEFSCTNSPIYPSYYTSRKFYNHHRRRHRGAAASAGGHAVTVAAVEKVFDFLNNNYEKAEGSPVMLPGFGQSPAVRQLRVTDSPFPLKDGGEEDGQVDKAAEEFISKFYKQLKLQKRIGSVESPSPYHLWGR